MLWRRYRTGYQKCRIFFEVNALTIFTSLNIVIYTCVSEYIFPTDYTFVCYFHPCIFIIYTHIKTEPFLFSFFLFISLHPSPQYLTSLCMMYNNINILCCACLVASCSSSIKPLAVGVFFFFFLVVN